MSFMFLLFFGLNSQRRQIFSQLCPEVVSSRSFTNAASAALKEKKRAKQWGIILSVYSDIRTEMVLAKWLCIWFTIHRGTIFSYFITLRHKWNGGVFYSTNIREKLTKDTIIYHKIRPLSTRQSALCHYWYLVKHIKAMWKMIPMLFGHWSQYDLIQTAPMQAANDPMNLSN